jgi:hypothetical protein
VNHEIVTGDCLSVMSEMEDNCVDLVFCSPPYEDARTYGIDFKLKGQDWVDWSVERYLQCVRVCRGLVCWVVEGKTKQFRYSATPILLMADLHRAGVKLRKPPAFHRVGIAGSGGPDWLRNDYEFIVCSSKGKLPWSDNTAMGHPPKWAPGGEMSYRNSDGTRRNQWGHSGTGENGTRKANGERTTAKRVGHSMSTNGERLSMAEKSEMGGKPHTKMKASEMEKQVYLPPALANPGNVLKFVVGGGVMGNRLCHDNEAPFPVDLAAFFVKSFCPPAGIVLDCFAGSGTVADACEVNGRNSISIDIRDCDAAGKTLIQKRLASCSQSQSPRVSTACSNSGHPTDSLSATD